jgi:hypothetical protein
MPDWRRILVGDAFQVSPDGINHYRDLFLLWPFLPFLIVAISSLLDAGAAHRVVTFKFALCAVVTILAAKERLLLLLVALGYVGIRLPVAVFFVHDWKVSLRAVFCGGTIYAMARSGALSNWTPSYPTEKARICWTC